MDKVIPFLKTIHEEIKIIVQTIRCDNAGENKILEENCKNTTGLAHIKFQYTPRDTPQINRVVEQAFATLFGQVWAINNTANLTQQWLIDWVCSNHHSPWQCINHQW